MTDTHCPGCGSERVHRSRRRSPLEYGLAAIGWRAARCHECKTRFVQFGGLIIKADRLEHWTKRLCLAAVAAAAVLVVVAAILWVSHSEAPAGPAETPAVSSSAPRRPVNG